MGKMVTLFNDQVKIAAVVENHKASSANVLFHLSTEQCLSSHTHKVSI